MGSATGNMLGSLSRIICNRLLPSVDQYKENVEKYRNKLGQDRFLSISNSLSPNNSLLPPLHL
jgi:hypothetical protein